MGMNGCILCAVARTLRDAHNKDNDGKPIVPYEVYYRLKSISEEFEFGQEEDAADFFRNLVNAMKHAFIHNDPANIDAFTPISNIFCGHQIQTTQCDCGNETDSDSTFDQLNLQINKNIKSLRDAFDFYFDLGHTKDYYCLSCKQKVLAKQKIRIKSAPKTLCIILNRFEQQKVKNKITFKKLTNEITFPENLDMAKYADSKDLRYRLGSVISHVGESINKGHYKAFCLVESMPSGYFGFDDVLVERMSTARVLHQQAYILFYYLNETAVK